MKIFNKPLIVLCTIFISFSTFEGNCSNNYMNNSMYFSQNNQNMNNINSSLFAQKTYNPHSTINDAQNTEVIDIPVPTYSTSFPKMLISKKECERYTIFSTLMKPDFYNKNPLTDTQYIQPLISSLSLLLTDMKNKTISEQRANKLCNYMLSVYDIFVTERFSNPMMNLYWEIRQNENAIENNSKANIKDPKNSDTQDKQQIAKHDENFKESHTDNKLSRQDFDKLNELYTNLCNKYEATMKIKNDLTKDIPSDSELSKLWEDWLNLINEFNKILSKQQLHK